MYEKVGKEFLTLLKRRKKPIKADDIIVLLHIQDGVPSYAARRYVTRIRKYLLDQGALIVANRNGYYIPRNSQDLTSYINTTKKRAFTIFKNLHEILKLSNSLISLDNKLKSKKNKLETVLDSYFSDAKKSAPKKRGKK